MLSVSALYDNGKIMFMEPVPESKKFRIIVTFVEELGETSVNGKFVGSLTGIGKTVADLTEPFEDEWELD
jgi:hypothetical protein